MLFRKHVTSLALGLSNIGGVLSQSCGSNCPLHTLVFEDDFTAATVDETVWNYRTDSKQYSTQTPANVNLTDGNMNIWLLQEKIGKTNFTGGGLVSKPNFHYGFYEARMQINKGSGWHSSFWHMAGNGSTTGIVANPTWTELDSFEIESSNTSQIRHNVFTWHIANGQASGAEPDTTGMEYEGYDFSAGFNVFGTLWNETSVGFYVNGNRIKTYSYPALTNPHDYLNIWLTCIAYQTANPVPGGVVKTDYVRFYGRDYYLTATSLCRGLYMGSTPCDSNRGYSETGTWSQSTTISGYTKDLLPRYSSGAAGSTASWSKTVPVAGTYQISAWIIARSDGDKAAKYSVTNNGAAVGTAQTVDQTSGSPAWVTLVQSVTLSANDVVDVTLTASGTGYTRSDTVKLVRIA